MHVIASCISWNKDGEFFCIVFSKTVSFRSDMAVKEVTEDYKYKEWVISEGKREACLNMLLKILLSLPMPGWCTLRAEL